jgi:hypothetical protein
METKVSATKIVLNERVKGVAKEIQTRYGDRLRTNYLLTNQETLFKIRRDYIQSLPEYKLGEESPHSYPDFFALMLLTISDIDTVRKLDDLLPPDFYRFDLFGFDNSSELPEREFKCCCSHLCNPDSLYCVQNPATEFFLIIGCDCATKRKLITLSQKKALKKKAKESETYQRFKETRERKALSKKSAEKKIGELFCSYLTALQEMRKCQTCNVLKVEKDLPYWRKHCPTCYFKSKKIEGCVI